MASIKATKTELAGNVERYEALLAKTNKRQERESKTIKMHSRDSQSDAVTLTAAIQMIKDGYWVNERLAREVCSAIYGETVQCETFYVGGKRKVCVLEYGANYVEFKTWREAVLTFIAEQR